MNIAFVPAAPDDLEPVIGFMRQLREDDPEEGAFDEPGARAAVAGLLADDLFGGIWLIRADGEHAGYVVLTIGYSIEFGGRIGWIDELFVARPHRGRGLGRAAMAFIESLARRMHLRLLMLEVTQSNARAQTLYARAGYVPRAHRLLVKSVEPE